MDNKEINRLKKENKLLQKKVATLEGIARRNIEDANLSFAEVKQLRKELALSENWDVIWDFLKKTNKKKGAKG